MAKSEICSAGHCPDCGAEFRVPSDSLRHTCFSQRTVMVPVDGSDTHVWPSWREALVDAYVGVERAYERRARVFQAAYDAGLTMRQIGEAVGMSAANVNKIIGKQRGGGAALLDAPAGLAPAAASDEKERSA